MVIPAIMDVGIAFTLFVMDCVRLGLYEIL
jgi:hypothetical protein